MRKCKGCDVDWPEEMFAAVEGGEHYSHLEFVEGEVCRNCQVNPVECSSCRRIYPPSTKYFYKKRGGKFGIAKICIPCTAQNSHDRHFGPRHEENLERMREYKKAR